MEEQLGKAKKDKIVIGYCRVSSKKHQSDLERQIENVPRCLISQGKPFQIIQDIGSGIKYDKKGLTGLLRLVMNKKVSKIVVLYKVRLESKN